MRVHCPLEIEALLTEEFGELDYTVMGHDDENAFELTAFSKRENDYQGHLQCLLNLSPLRSIHWINVDPHGLSFRTVDEA